MINQCICTIWIKKYETLLQILFWLLQSILVHGQPDPNRAGPSLHIGPGSCLYFGPDGRAGPSSGLPKTKFWPWSGVFGPFGARTRLVPIYAARRSDRARLGPEFSRSDYSRPGPNFSHIYSKVVKTIMCFCLLWFPFKSVYCLVQFKLRLYASYDSMPTEIEFHKFYIFVVFSLRVYKMVEN